MSVFVRLIFSNKFGQKSIFWGKIEILGKSKFRENRNLGKKIL